MSKKLMVAIVIGLFFVTFAPATLAVVAADAPIMVHLLDDGWDDVDAAGKPTKPAPVQPDQILPWGVDWIDADHAGMNTGEGVKIAILDTGVDKDHPDLDGNIKGGRNFVVIRGKINPDKYDDDNGHGTHVAGTIAAEDNLELIKPIGVIGVAPLAYIYAVKVLNSQGSGYLTDVVKGIQWAIDNDMDVISMSLSTSYDYNELRTACQNAYNAGIVIVAAAGNEGGSVGYPAAYDTVIAVSATDRNNNTAYFTNYGPQIDLAAPGVSVYSTYNNGLYATMSGTSMACPHVSGTAALVLRSSIGNYDLDADGAWDPAEVKAKLYATADDLGVAGIDNYYGNGLVDAENAAA